MATPLLNELLERRQKKAAALIAEAQAKANAAKAAPKAQPAQDHVPPKIGAKQVMAGFARTMEITRARRLQELARKHPEVAKLMESAKPAVKSAAKSAQAQKPAKVPVVPPVVVPPVESV